MNSDIKFLLVRVVREQDDTDAALSGIENGLDRLRKMSDDQIRSMTELLLGLVRLDRRLRHSPSVDSPRRSLDIGEDRAGSVSISRSNTLPARQSRHIVALLQEQDRRGSPAPSPQEKFSPRTEGRHRREGQYSSPATNHFPATSETVASPRALRRAKSSSTSQVSQSTVRGVMHSSPPKPGGFFSPPDRQFAPSIHSSRRSSIASVDDSYTTGIEDSPAQSSSAVFSRPSIETPVSARLQSQASMSGDTNTPSRSEASGGSTTSRWRTFGRRNRQEQGGLPDSPSQAQQQNDTPNRSSELARTLSRVSGFRPR